MSNAKIIALIDEENKETRRDIEVMIAGVAKQFVMYDLQIAKLRAELNELKEKK